ncbi:hypothetical protein [Saccharibacter floricola]|uniref:Uncharacterized protein n=1 Tax=Saccharibacter floricola DSM 15669 TaxID=1123227 RepID=A0ABQ0P0Q4_9PROT|nr:hypothetical protein [Saccharibacter floricola]GBQ08071.1 hypothetical protein AA15669_1648 [Saccharibacter floricola DSM 15669]
MTTASDVITSLEHLITGALGSSESAATKTRIHAVASVLGSLGDDLAPMLESKFNITELFDAIQRVENGATELEEGSRTLLAVLEHKNSPAPQTGDVNSAI